MSCGYASIRNVATGGVVCYRSQVAATFYSRLAGLLGADNFDGFDGLLLRPSSSIHTLGMTFPIDVVALDQNRTIIGVRVCLVPQRLAFFKSDTREVLELPAGQIGRAVLSLGDRLSIEVASFCGE